jgi:hypothetical protein
LKYITGLCIYFDPSALRRYFEYAINRIKNILVTDRTEHPFCFCLSDVAAADRTRGAPVTSKETVRILKRIATETESKWTVNLHLGCNVSAASVFSVFFVY